MKICVTGCIQIETYDVPLLFKFYLKSEHVADYSESVHECLQNINLGQCSNTAQYLLLLYFNVSIFARHRHYLSWPLAHQKFFVARR